ncbi:MAG: hypothetical protein IJA32_07940 [Lachnospiraceae bacterium]|nr:hypothetical protein [Lachnospiraceae bacterium]
MNKGEYGYLQKYRKEELKKTLLLGLVILTGALICLAVLKTTKHIIILIPILASLPFAKSLINWFMVAKYKFVSKEDYEELSQLLDEDEKLLAELTFVTKESMFYLPIVWICENQVFFLYEKGLTKLTGEQINHEITDLIKRTGYTCKIVLCSDYKDLVDKIKKRTKKKDKDYSKTVNNLSQRFLDQSV